MTIQRMYQLIKNWYHFLQAHFWRAYYRWPDRGMKVYGVTGTNGKTTTCHIVASILRAARGKEHVGMLTTIAFWIGDQEFTNETKMTTLPSRLVYQYLRQMRDVGVTDAVMEMTSHALDQHRLAGIALDGAIILNIAREHLDYHKTMEDYAAAKGKIVNYLNHDAPLIAKRNDERVVRIVQKLESRKDKLRVAWFTSDEAQQMTTPLPGEVNKENTLAASLLMRAIGISEDAIQRGVATMVQVPGRMEWIELPSDQSSVTIHRLPRVLIDYAVTPDALERLYTDVRAQTKGKVCAVLGAAGLRDRGKRPDMARVVAQYADELVLTREDPWTEDEQQIFQDLEKGLSDARIPWKRIVDRRQAIRYCLQQAGSDGVVVVTGKGAEMGMAVGNEIIPWSDKKVILELLREL